MTSKTSTPTRLVKLLLDSMVKKKVADSKRMYIGGLSLGGFGTFNMIERYPGYFAAAFPICGGGDTAVVKRFAKNTGVWIFHGDKDPRVNVKYSREYYAALKRADGDVRYTEYPNVQHNSWDNAFAEKDLVHWLFTKKKK
jgi:predicted peptidase